MDSMMFDSLVENRIDLIREVLGKKGKEYAKGDRLYNFKRASEIGKIPPEKAWFGMFLKHLVSIIDMVEGQLEPTPQMVDEKIGDAINYLILLEAILKEEYLTEMRKDDSRISVVMSCVNCERHTLPADINKQGFICSYGLEPGSSKCMSIFVPKN